MKPEIRRTYGKSTNMEIKHILNAIKHTKKQLKEKPKKIIKQMKMAIKYKNSYQCSKSTSNREVYSDKCLH